MKCSTCTAGTVGTGTSTKGYQNVSFSTPSTPPTKIPETRAADQSSKATASEAVERPNRAEVADAGFRWDLVAMAGRPVDLLRRWAVGRPPKGASMDFG